MKRRKELAAYKRRIAKQIAPLIYAGSGLANAAFNLKQRAALDPQECKSLGEGQESWDAARRSLPDWLRNPA